MFLNTSEVSQIVLSMLWLVWSCPKRHLSVRMSKGTLVVQKVLGGCFASSEIVSYPDGSGCRGRGVAALSLENSRVHFECVPKF